MTADFYVTLRPATVTSAVICNAKDLHNNSCVKKKQNKKTTSRTKMFLFARLFEMFFFLEPRR